MEINIIRKSTNLETRPTSFKTPSTTKHYHNTIQNSITKSIKQIIRKHIETITHKDVKLLIWGIIWEPFGMHFPRRESFYLIDLVALGGRNRIDQENNKIDSKSNQINQKVLILEG